MSRGYPAEDDVQAAVIDYLMRCLPHALVWSTPNEGRRTPAERGRLLRLGLRAGVADLTVLMPDGQLFFLECKSATGKVSPEQKAFAAAVEDRGARWACVRSIDDLRAALAGWGVVTRERAA